MKPGIAGDFRMKRRSEQVPLLHCDHPAIGQRGQRSHANTDLFDHRRPDEDGVHRRITDLRNFEVSFEGVKLGSKRVSTHRNIEPAETLLARNRIEYAIGEHDQPRTGAVDGQPAANRLLERLSEPERAGEFVEHARLTAGDHQPGELGQFAWAAHRPSFDPEGIDYRDVLAEVPLQRENADNELVTSHVRTGDAVQAGQTR